MEDLFSQCGALLDNVSNRDYSGTDYFDKAIECLDMDAYEHKVRRPSWPEPTVDVVIGIGDSGVGVLDNKRLLMIELRMNYTNTNNLHGFDSIRKMAHTKDLQGEDLKVDEMAWFVFVDGVAPVAGNWLSRGSLADSDRKLSKGKICGVSQFRECIQSPLRF